MHALGICEGFASDKWDVTFVGGKGIKSFKSELPASVNFIEVEEPTGIFKYPIWWLRFIRVYLSLIKTNEYKCMMSRYVVSSFIPILLFSLFSKKETFKIVEVNSFAYHMLSKLPSLVNKLVARFEMILMNHYNLVYVVSDTMVTDPRNASCKSKIVCVPNGATTKKVNFVPTTINNTASARLVYFGTLMPYWDFEFLVNAVNELHSSIDMKIVFLGDGPKIEYLKQNIHRKELCVFHGRFGRNELGSLLNKEHDILLLPPKTKEDMLLSGGLSTKLFDYLSMRMPIVAPSDGEIENVLSHKVNSVLYSSSSTLDFSKKVIDISSNVEQRSIISDAAYSDFKNKYSWSARMKTIIGEIS
ncbi:hypothetical protein VYA_02120 [Vibrio alfacsensis]|nr:hypothetical protein VYA_02120 [Vibrio alfacsensis]